MPVAKAETGKHASITPEALATDFLEKVDFDTHHANHLQINSLDPTKPEDKFIIFLDAMRGRPVRDYYDVAKVLESMASKEHNKQKEEELRTQAILLRDLGNLRIQTESLLK